MENFEPKIIGFCCNWCAYAGADLAGVSRLQYPPNLRMIRIMCSGAIAPLHILEAFHLGADGVFIGGCHPGDCHYLEGNYKTLRRILLLKKLLPQFGIEPERLRLEWVSAAEGQRFAQVVTDFVEEIKKLGPSPLKGDAYELAKVSDQLGTTSVQAHKQLKLSRCPRRNGRAMSGL